MKENIFISYARVDNISNQIIESIENNLSNFFNIIIDIKNVKYKDRIKDFEDRLGNGDKVILIISDAYLKSKHCMYEALKIIENGNVYNRIFPIILEDALIHNSNDIIDYIKYWQDQESLLSKKLKILKSDTKTNKIRKDLEYFVRFRMIIDDFTSTLKSMNTLNAQYLLKKNLIPLKEVLINEKIKNTKGSDKFFQNLIITKNLYQKSIAIISGEIYSQNIKAHELLDKVIFFYEQLKNQSFLIAVMAMVKSGKSTFLNSLMGNEFLPMSNVPETSVPVKIIHTEGLSELLIVDEEEIKGAKNIIKCLENINGKKRKEGIQHDINCELYSPIIALKKKEMSDIKFEIIDTPGFGEALTEITAGKSINQSITEIIDKLSAVIYLLDYTKLKTEEENEVIEKFTNMRADILEKIQDRIFFIINKIDRKDRTGLPPNEAIEYAYNLIQQKMPGINKNQFFNLSASKALLARLILSGIASEEARIDFGTIAFGEESDEKNEDDYIRGARKMIKKSNISEIEENIISHIFTNRNRIFIEGLQDNLKRLLIEFKK